MFLSFYFSVSFDFCCCWLSVAEIVGVEYRRTTGISYQLMFSVGVLILPLLAYLIADWRWLQVAVSAPYLLFLVYYW